MRIFILSLSLIASVAWAKKDADLKPFLTDGCTSYAEGTRAQPDLWKHCCVEHDLFFWAGGSHAERKETDLRLKSCVEKTGELTHARLIYLGVTIGDTSPIHFKGKQWGHAFEGRERYLSLNEREKASVIHHIEMNNPELSNELKQFFKEQLNSRLDDQ